MRLCLLSDRRRIRLHPYLRNREMQVALCLASEPGLTKFNAVNVCEFARSNVLGQPAG
jgi:hypothetical protein